MKNIILLKLKISEFWWKIYFIVFIKIKFYHSNKILMENIITNFTKLIYQKSLRIRLDVLDFVILF